MEIQSELLEFHYFHSIGFRIIAWDGGYRVDDITHTIRLMPWVSQVGYRRTACYCHAPHPEILCQRNAWDVSLRRDYSSEVVLREIVWQICAILPERRTIFRGPEGNIIGMNTWLSYVAAIGGF